MKNDFLIYIIKTALVFSVLYLPFLWFKKDTFFTRNRFYLLFVLIASVIVPAFSLRISENKPITAFILPVVKASDAIVAPTSSFDSLQFISTLFAFISILFLAHFIYSIFRVVLLIALNKKEKNNSQIIVWLKNTHGFSFFNYIFLSKENYHPRIHAHERVHATRWHSADVILFELYRCLQWFNPFLWLAIRDLKAQHEFEADAAESAQNKYEYQALLLSSVLDSSPVFMTHSFYCLTIKERIKMMNKIRSPKKALIKTILVLPFALVSLAFTTHVVPVDEKSKPQQDFLAEQEEKIMMPEFKGGNEALMKFLIDNIRYPEKSKKDKVTGKVFVGFVIDANGKVGKTEIKKGVSPEIDAEALRVVKSMPDWNPGTKNGKPTSVEMTLPMMFQL